MNSFCRCSLPVWRRSFLKKGTQWPENRKLRLCWLWLHRRQLSQNAYFSSPAHRPSSVNFHIFNFFSRIAWWILMKIGRDEVLMVPYKCCCSLARSTQGRIQGGAKISHGGPLLQETSSSDWKATNRMHSHDLEACGNKCCYFWFHSEVKFWRVLTSFGLSHFGIF